jgi:hypothetical protein
MAAAEVQALLQEARRAQEHEDDGDCGAAAECYYKAACQLSYVLDLQVEKGSALAAMCQGLLQMYQQRIAVRACPAERCPAGALSHAHMCVCACVYAWWRWDAWLLLCNHRC